MTGLFAVNGRSVLMPMGLMLMNGSHQAPPAALGCRPSAKTAKRLATFDFKQPRAACTALFWIGDRVIIQAAIEDFVILPCITSSVMLVTCYLQAVVALSGLIPALLLLHSVDHLHCGSVCAVVKGHEFLGDHLLTSTME